MLNTFTQVCKFVPEAGFSTPENMPSSKSKPSQYEIQIPEYISKEVIYLMAMKLDNPTAVSFQSKLVSEVIPFFEQHADAHTVANTAIIGNMVKTTQALCSGPMSQNIMQSRNNLLEGDMREVSQFYAKIHGYNHTIPNEMIYDILLDQVNEYLKANCSCDLVTCCFSMLQKKIGETVTKQDIMNCILGSTWLFEITRYCVVAIHNIIENGAIDKANGINDEEEEKGKLEEDTLKDVVSFVPLQDIYHKPEFIKE